ncbi:MAG TPA: 5-formyltetrahydrofolate cyclo-ligase [Alphaproteobacteria bacterium]|nr:5-formyltetrahydrofolate cyclo-ligase [Alphaproteobacteria bacterium]
MSTATAPADPRHDKRELRALARGRRADAHAALGTAAGTQLRDIALAALTVERDAVIGSYWPFRDEIDSAPLLRALHEAGHPVGLPVVAGPGKDGKPRPMTFRPWRPGMRLAKGRLGEPTLPPDADYGAGDLVPTLLLVPLLAFDRRGYRIGYGGGNFDATIAHLRAAGALTTVGVAYSDQEVDAVPIEPHDEALDWIVTEREAIRIGAAG